MDEKIEINPEDFEGYGEEMQNLVGLVKDQDKTIKEQDEKLKTIDERQEQIGGRQYESDSDSFYTELTKQVSDWQTINKSKEFVDWLAEIDPFTGIARHALLDDAHSRLDLDRVAHFFNTFKGGGPISSPSNNVSKAAYTVQDVSRAAKDYQTGRITEEEFNKIANSVQRSISGS